MNKGIKRRDFFKLAAAGGAAAAVAGCEPNPVETIIPMLVPPDDYVPGVTIQFATTCNECSAQCGMVIRTREARAIKAEGNLKNPLNEGRLCAIGQGSMQGLYSPARAKGPMTQQGGSQSALSWSEGVKLLREKLQSAGGSVVYVGQKRSGTLEKLKREFIQSVGGKVFAYDPNPGQSIIAGNRLVFGKAEIPHYAIEDAKVLVSFGSDFMETWLSPVAFTRGYTKMHAFKGGEKGKYIHVSSHMSLTGTNADQWIDTNPGTEAQVALAVAGLLLGGASMGSGDKDRLRDYLAAYSVDRVSAQTGVPVEKIQALAKAFKQNGASLAIAGGTTACGSDATALQVAVSLLNLVAGNVGKTVQFGANYDVAGDSVAEILKAIQAGPKVLILENANLAYSLPKSSGIVEAIKKAGFVVSLSTEHDETSALAALHLPVSHYLESWGDATPRQGLYSLQQPVMAKVPGYDTQGLGDLLLTLQGNKGEFRTYLMKAWEGVKSKTGSTGSFEGFWKQALQAGGVFTAFKAQGAGLSSQATSVKPKEKKITGLTLLPAASSLHNASGSTGNRAWFLEVAHPVTQLVWDSWVEIHPDTAAKLGLKQSDEVEVTTEHGTQTVGVWIWYGVNRNAISMPLGRGRSVAFPTYVVTKDKSILLPHVEMQSSIQIKGMQVGEKVTDLMAYANDQSGDLAYNETSVQLKATGKRAWMVSPEGQALDDIEGLADAVPGGDRSQKDRGFVRMTSVKAIRGEEEEGASLAHPHKEHHLRERQYITDLPSNTDFYEERVKDVAKSVDWSGRDKPVYYEKYKWEMGIDLDRCTGCSACVVACNAENNIPSVGKERMWSGREMNWIRIERYIEHNHETGEQETYYTPEMCQQCGNAGCEPVCPVYATYHNDEGINAMIYNRCVGTRYCLNNCIYKQRRFNWRTFEFPAPLHLQLNPGVTVRTRGVMEKCNFCIARIREAKDLAKDAGNEVFDGAFETACQQTCPAEAIVFGNMKDPNSAVYKLKTSTQRGYKQLEEMNFKPAITYLKKVTHDNRKA